MEPAESSTSFEIPAHFSAILQEKTTVISKLADDEACSILKAKKIISLPTQSMKLKILGDFI